MTMLLPMPSRLRKDSANRPLASIKGILFDLDGTLMPRSQVRLVAMIAFLPFWRRVPLLRRVCTLNQEKLELLDQLRRSGIRLGIVTNGLAYKRRAIQALGLKARMDCIQISSRSHARKPDGKIFWKALFKLGVRPSRALFVGDSIKADMQGARRLGLRTMLISSSRPHTASSQSSVDVVARSILELRDILESPDGLLCE